MALKRNLNLTVQKNRLHTVLSLKQKDVKWICWYHLEESVHPNKLIEQIQVDSFSTVQNFATVRWRSSHIQTDEQNDPTHLNATP